MIRLCSNAPVNTSFAGPRRSSSGRRSRRAGRSPSSGRARTGRPGRSATRRTPERISAGPTKNRISAASAATPGVARAASPAAGRGGRGRRRGGRAPRPEPRSVTGTVTSPRQPRPASSSTMSCGRAWPANISAISSFIAPPTDWPNAVSKYSWTYGAASRTLSSRRAPGPRPSRWRPGWWAAPCRSRRSPSAPRRRAGSSRSRPPRRGRPRRPPTRRRRRARRSARPAPPSTVGNANQPRFSPRPALSSVSPCMTPGSQWPCISMATLPVASSPEALVGPSGPGWTGSPC